MKEQLIFDQSSPEIQYLCKKDKRLANVIEMVGPISYQPHIDQPYSFLIHEIIEQMLSVKAGAKIFDRLNNICRGTITPESIAALTVEQLRSIGTSNAKAMYIKGITTAVMTGQLDFAKLEELDDDTVIKQLTRFRGIGNWTAKMYLIFVLNRPDVLPYEDVAFLQGYAWVYKTSDFSPASVMAKCKKWKPYSSIAARYMYRALDAGLTKTEFHLFKQKGVNCDGN